VRADRVAARIDPCHVRQLGTGRQPRRFPSRNASNCVHFASRAAVVVVYRLSRGSLPGGRERLGGRADGRDHDVRPRDPDKNQPIEKVPDADVELQPNAASRPRDLRRRRQTHVDNATAVVSTERSGRASALPARPVTRCLLGFIRNHGFEPLAATGPSAGLPHRRLSPSSPARVVKVGSAPRTRLWEGTYPFCRPSHGPIHQLRRLTPVNRSAITDADHLARRHIYVGQVPSSTI
jgi:hypothetical protein